MDPISNQQFSRLFLYYATKIWLGHMISSEVQKRLKEFYLSNIEIIESGKFNVNMVYGMAEDDFGTSLKESDIRHIENAIIDQFNGASIYALFEGLKECGAENQYDYWFFPDREDPIECDCKICHKIADKNPYTYSKARGIFLPHRGCWSTWKASPKQ
jgi:hypothetical protein